MGNNIFDVCIIGAGVAGAFAAVRIAEKHNNVNTLLLDIGRPPARRRRQIEGYLGCLPTGDGKLYPSDTSKINQIVDGRQISPAYKWVHKHMAEVNPMKLIRSSSPSKAALKRINNTGFEPTTLDYIQWKPESVHKLSKLLAEIMETSSNIKYGFDTEVYTLRKAAAAFEIDTSRGIIHAKRIILCVGRSGWRWVTNLYDDLGIISDDDWAKFGVRIETSASNLRDFNKSHLILKSDKVEIGPLLWNGTIIPEDHSDLVISAFRSNEDRWKSSKVSFSLLRSRYFQNDGSVQADRLGKLAFLLFNDRVSREKIKLFLRDKSQLNYIPEYNWLKQDLLDLEKIFPNICSKGYLYIPTISPTPAKIRLTGNLESEVDGMFVAGEATGISGIMAAAIMGKITADNVCK